jgi:hypothetical protein
LTEHAHRAWRGFDETYRFPNWKNPQWNP